MTSPGVLLDVDGTLLDSNYLHVVAWTRAFRRIGRDATMADVHRRVGMGGDKLMEDLLGEERDDAQQAWSEEFHHLLPEVRPLPGARRLVQVLHDRRFTVVLASSAPGEDVASFRKLLDVDDLLAGATSSDDAEGSKPDTDIFDAAIDRFDLDRSATWAVGDAVWDADAATKAGIGFLGVETGGTPAVVLAEHGAARVFADADALAAAIEGGQLSLDR